MRRRSLNAPRVRLVPRLGFLLLWLMGVPLPAAMLLAVVHEWLQGKSSFAVQKVRQRLRL